MAIFGTVGPAGAQNVDSSAVRHYLLLGLQKDEEMEILERMTDVLTSSHVSVPISQVIALLILSTLALLSDESGWRCW